LSGIVNRMLGSKGDANEVVQASWLHRHASQRENLQSAQPWLTTDSSIANYRNAILHSRGA
jgi:hypothetical protein